VSLYSREALHIAGNRECVCVSESKTAIYTCNTTYSSIHRFITSLSYAVNLF